MQQLSVPWSKSLDGNVEHGSAKGLMKVKHLLQAGSMHTLRRPHGLRIPHVRHSAHLPCPLKKHRSVPKRVCHSFRANRHFVAMHGAMTHSLHGLEKGIILNIALEHKGLSHKVPDFLRPHRKRCLYLLLPLRQSCLLVASMLHAHPFVAQFVMN